MKILDLAQINSNILNEANILNVKDPHDGHSLQKYLAQYAKAIGTDVAKKMFQKKLQKLLLNDPKYHFAVRELPNDAPEWAQQAMAQRDLFFFKSNPQLDNTMEHLTHYIAKMEEDMAGNNKNFKAIATKEFAGFVKAESLDVLEQKSNKYFEQTTAKATNDFPGTKVIYSSGGFTWMKLETAEAFRNAGNTLNNCIGSHWTKAKTDNAGESIIVLADSKNALIVAARIKNKENELQEMKGKNNQPPIKAYMSPVAAMINKFKLSLSSSAHHDVVSAGYYFDEETKKLLTKPQALKKLVAYDVLGTIANGLKLVQPKPSQDNEASRILFSELYTGSAYNYRNGMGGDLIFEGRLENGNPVMTAIIKAGTLTTFNTYFNERLHDESHLKEALDLSKKHDYVKTFVSELISRDKIDDIKSDILRHIFWELNLEWDKENKRLVDRVKGEDRQFSKKDHKWSKYVDKSTIDTIAGTFDHNLDKVSFPIKKIFVATEEVADDRSRNETDMHVLVVVDANNNGHLANASGKGMSEDHVGFKKEIEQSHYRSSFKRVAVDNKTMRSIVTLAKEENFNLMTPAKARFGVTGDDPEHYKRADTKWEKIPGDPEAIKADFSHLRDDDRFTAVYSTAMTELGGVKSNDAFELHDKLQNNNGRFNYDRDNINKATHFDGHDGASANAAIGDVDTIYKVNVGYGTASAKHGAMVLVSKKKIIKLDTMTEKHTWQGWDDFDAVAKTLNKFAADHNLVFDKKAVTTDNRARTEFRVVDGKLSTMQSVKKGELSRKKKKEGVDSLEFADGWVLERMTPDDQSKWIRRGIKDGVRGQAWLLKDDAGQKAAVFTILHQRVARMFFNNEPAADYPTSSGVKRAKYLPYLKTAMEQFKWRGAKTGVMKDKNIPDQTMNDLKYFKRQTEPKSYRMTPSRSNQQLQQMTRDGLLSNADGSRSYAITQMGKDAIDLWDAKKRADPQASVTEFDILKGKEPHGDFSIPDTTNRQNATPRPAGGAPRTTRTAVGGGATKSTQALEKFKGHVEEHGQIPSRSQFIAYMGEEPFNMSKAGAQTYYYTTKKKYANLNESILGNLSELLLIEPDAVYTSFKDMVIG